MRINSKLIITLVAVTVFTSVGAKHINSSNQSKATEENRTVTTAVKASDVSQPVTTVGEKRCEKAITTTAAATTTAETSATTTTTTTVTTTAETKPVPPTLTVNNAVVEAASVSELKITWDAEEERTYTLNYETYAPYSENINFVVKGNDLVYLTGLRADSEYTIEIIPDLKEGEEAKVISVKLTGHTQSVESIWDFEYEEGWTNCFAGEKASGLTAMPSSGAIYGSSVDTVTDTGIRRFENGDYCCAMGVWYGYCNDRFLVELENGIQFTTRICDSKGWADDADGDEVPDGRFHWFGGTGNGKCIIEFIYDDSNLPSCVACSGSWGYYNWNGLNLGSNIKSIQKINY